MSQKTTPGDWHLFCHRDNGNDGRRRYITEVTTMQAFKKLISEQDVQGLVEYTMILFFVAFALWLAVKDTTVAATLTDNWTTIVTCVSAPFACGSGS